MILAAKPGDLYFIYISCIYFSVKSLHPCINLNIIQITNLTYTFHNRITLLRDLNTLFNDFKCNHVSFLLVTDIAINSPPSIRFSENVLPPFYCIVFVMYLVFIFSSCWGLKEGYGCCGRLVSSLFVCSIFGMTVLDLFLLLLMTVT